MVYNVASKGKTGARRAVRKECELFFGMVPLLLLLRRTVFEVLRIMSREFEIPVSPVFDRVDWAAAGVATLIALTIYCVTLAPNVTLEQSGALVVAGQYCGVGRMPGYPLWHMLAKLFITVFGFVRYRGCPNPGMGNQFHVGILWRALLWSGRASRRSSC